MNDPNTSPMRVVFFTNLFPNPAEPVRGIFNLQLARQLGKICQLTVVSPLPWFPHLSFLRRFSRWYAYSKIPNAYEVDGIEVLSPKYFMIPRISGAFQAWLVRIGSARVMRQLASQKRLDVINALWLYPDAVAAEDIAADLGCPSIPAALGSDVNRMFEEVDKRAQIFCMLRRAPRIIVVSASLGEKISQLGIDPSKICVIPNGVDERIFFPRDKFVARSELCFDADRRLVLFVGRLSPEKGVAILIDAIARARVCGFDYDLCIVGDGPLRDQLEELARRKHVEDRVRFVGAQPHWQIANFMNACDIFCLPSLTEGCPNVVNEALACGRPVVASAVGGLPDMISETCGMLVAPQDSALLDSALREAFVRRWDSESIIDSVREKTWESVAKQYLDCYKSVVADAEAKRPG